jgi:hypothetical protein
MIDHALNRGNRREAVFHKPAGFEALVAAMNDAQRRVSVDLFGATRSSSLRHDWACVAVKVQGVSVAGRRSPGHRGGCRFCSDEAPRRRSGCGFRDAEPQPAMANTRPDRLFRQPPCWRTSSAIPCVPYWWLEPSIGNGRACPAGCLLMTRRSLVARRRGMVGTCQRTPLKRRLAAIASFGTAWSAVRQ